MDDVLSKNKTRFQKKVKKNCCVYMMICSGTLVTFIFWICYALFAFPLSNPDTINLFAAQKDHLDLIAEGEHENADDVDFEHFDVYLNGMCNYVYPQAPYDESIEYKIPDF
jgi:hypothetical protein